MTKMCEKKTSLKVPLLDDLKLEDLRLLNSHEGNANRMTVKQKEQLWHSLQRYGWLVPIITDADGIVVDGGSTLMFALHMARRPVLRHL